MSSDELSAYKNSLKKMNKFLNYIEYITFYKYPDLLKGDSLKEKIKEIDNTQKLIDETMIQFKKLFTEKLLVLTAMRSLLWHFKSTIKESEDVKELRDRIRIFILPELERFINSFKREINIIDNKIKPLLGTFRDIQNVVDKSVERTKEFKDILKINGEDKASILEKLINLLLEGKLEEFNKLISEATLKEEKTQE